MRYFFFKFVIKMTNIIQKKYSCRPSNSLEYTLRSQFEKSQARLLNCSPVSFKETSHIYIYI